MSNQYGIAETDQIAKVEHGTYGVKSKWDGPDDVTIKTGNFLIMKNGQVWFHPNDGGQPIRCMEREEPKDKLKEAMVRMRDRPEYHKGHPDYEALHRDEPME